MEELRQGQDDLRQDFREFKDNTEKVLANHEERLTDVGETVSYLVHKIGEHDREIHRSKAQVSAMSVAPNKI